MKTPAEIDAEIAALEKCLDYAPPLTMFGDDNHRGIRLQIETLRDEIDTTAEEFETEFSEDEHSDILAAIDWADGQIAESPSSGWDAFKPKKKGKKK